MNAALPINKPTTSQSTTSKSVVTALLGVGVTGASVIRFMRRFQKTCDIYDSNLTANNVEKVIQSLNIDNIQLGDFTVDALNKYDEIIVSPGIPTRHVVLQELVRLGVLLIGDIELFSRQRNKPVIAISGSNGKSTVTTLIGLMASRQGLKVGVGGNLDVSIQLHWGLPALDLLTLDVDLYVLELSSFQLELVQSLNPEIALLLNVTPDHLDYYPSLLEYHKAKQRIFKQAKIQIYNSDDSLTTPLHAPCDQQKSFTCGMPNAQQWGISTIGSNQFITKGSHIVINCDELKLQGHHHYSNALAALSVADAMSWDLELCANVLREFSGLPHRMELISQRFDIRWVNDSKATNVASTISAIKSISHESSSTILIMGGDAKEQDFTPLIAMIASHLTMVIVIGKDISEFRRLLKPLEASINVEYSGDLKRAVSIARHYAKANDTVLLSPACASYDQFDHYRQRGQLFSEYIESMPSKGVTRVKEG